MMMIAKKIPMRMKVPKAKLKLPLAISKKHKKKEDYDKTMSSNSCFYIQSAEHKDLGLTSDVGDEYASKYQLINIDVHHLVSGNNHQKWKYDENTRKLSTWSHPDMSSFAGSNANVVLF